MTSISKNVYFDVLDDIVDKYNNTYHNTIKMKPINLKIIILLNTMKNLMRKIINLKQTIMLESQSTKISLRRDILLIGVKKFLF